MARALIVLVIITLLFSIILGPAWSGPAHTAAQKGDIAALRIALEGDAEAIHALDEKFKATPLHFAASYGQREMVRYLLDKGAKATALNKDGQTPLHLAVATGNMEIIEMLMAQGADLNGKDFQGNTPLHFATFRNDVNFIMTLVAKGANPRAANSEGHKPWGTAKQHGNYGVAALLYEMDLNGGTLNKPKDVVYKKLMGDRGPIHAMTFSQDGGLFAIGYGLENKLGEIELRKPPYDEAHMILKGHTSQITSLAFSPDGMKLYSGSIDQSIRCWNVATGETEQVFNVLGSSAGVTSLAVSGDGTKLICGCLDATARVFNVQTGKETRMLKGHVGPVMHVAYAPDGLTVATASQDKYLALWSVSKGEVVKVFQHPKEVTAVIYSADGNQLITSCADGRIRFCSATGVHDVRLEHPLRRTFGEVAPIGFAFTTSGLILVVAFVDGTIGFYSDRGQKDERIDTIATAGDLLAIALSPDARYLMVSMLSESAKTKKAPPVDLFKVVSEHDLQTFVAEMQKGIEVNITNSDGATLLHMAARHGHRDIAELLVKQGANPDAQDNQGLTPVQWTVLRGDKAMTEWFLERGADPNAPDRAGRNLLHLAVAPRELDPRAPADGYPELVRLLLQYGTNYLAVDRKDRSPRDLARGECAKILADK